MAIVQSEQLPVSLPKSFLEASAPGSGSQLPAPSPAMALNQMIWGTWIAQSIYVAASLGIADLLENGAKHVDELATATKAQSSNLYRILRTLASVGIFTEIAPHQFALTDMAHYLRSEVPGSLRAVSMMLSDEWHWNSWGDILHVVKTGQAPMQHLYQVDSTFDYLDQHPESHKIYNKAMNGWSKICHSAVVDAYDFSGIQQITDVAGGYGSLVSAILAANPAVQGVLFDQPHVVADAIAFLEKAGVGDRCKAVGGNFFESIPAGSDAYIMSHILHDWSDEECVQILKNVRRGIAEHGRLLVVEMVVPTSNEFSFSKWMDIDMMIMYPAGRERTAAEFRELFQAAGFRLTQVVPTAAPVSVVEGVVEG
jgi:hypothetical protein